MPVAGSGPFVPGPHRRLTSPGVIRALMAREGLMPKRGYGQNFLTDANVLRIITSAAQLDAYDTAVEVGPGLGALTQALVEQCGKVYAIESDESMLRVLKEELSYVSNLVVIHADALAFDLESLWEGQPPDGIKMVSNLPYQIAATLLVKWLQNYPWLKEYTVMVQREVADRVVGRPGTKDYSSASVKIQHRADAERVANVSRNSFFPRPRVDSSIVKLVVKDVAHAEDNDLFDRVVTAAFGQRRKKIVNSVPAGLRGAAPADVAGALGEMGKSQNTRAEELSPEEFERLALMIKSRMDIRGQGRQAGIQT